MGRLFAKGASIMKLTTTIISLCLMSFVFSAKTSEAADVFCWRHICSETNDNIKSDNFNFVAEGTDPDHTMWAFTDYHVYKWDKAAKTLLNAYLDSLNHLAYLDLIAPGRSFVSDERHEDPPPFVADEDNPPPYPEPKLLEKISFAVPMSPSNMRFFDDVGNVANYDYSNKHWSMDLFLDFSEAFQEIPNEFTPSGFTESDVVTMKIQTPDPRSNPLVEAKTYEEEVIDYGAIRMKYPTFQLCWLYKRQNTRVADMAFGINGRQYFATDKGIFYFDNGMDDVKRITVPMGLIPCKEGTLGVELPSRSVVKAKDADGYVYFGYGSYVLILKDESKIHLSSGWGYKALPGMGDEYITDMVSDDNGRIIATTNGCGVVRFSKFSQKKIEYLLDVDGRAVPLDKYCIGVGLYQNSLWFASTVRVFKSNLDFKQVQIWDYANTGGLIGKSPEQNMYEANYIKRLFVASSGDVWLTTFGKGLLYGKRVD